MTNDDGFARAQADYDAQMPPEPVEHDDYTVEVAVTFYLTLGGCTFVEDGEEMHMGDQVKDWMHDDLMPRLKSAIRKEIEPSGVDLARFFDQISYGSTSIQDPVVDSEYEITDVHR